MSRGRGGYGAGRSGGVGGRKEKIGGEEVSWEYDPDLLIDSKPREMFPEIFVPQVPQPSALEKAQVVSFKAIRKRMHEGPLYSVIGDRTRVGKSAPKRAATFDPFEDMPSYIQKYKVPPKSLPRFETKKYDLRFFPKELWNIVDPKRRSRPDAGTSKTSTDDISGHPTLQSKLDEVEEDEQNEEGDAEITNADNEDDASEPNLEDDFEDDDSEMAEDYNAENYFDAGDDEFDGMDGDVGDDGGFD